MLHLVHVIFEWNESATSWPLRTQEANTSQMGNVVETEWRIDVRCQISHRPITFPRIWGPMDWNCASELMKSNDDKKLFNVNVQQFNKREIEWL